MNGELLNAFEYLEREKGIKREVLIKAVETSLLSASRKTFGTGKSNCITIDPKTGQIHVYSRMLVVEKIVNLKEEVCLEDARLHEPNAKVGDEINVEITPKDFGRIAAQTAKQVIIQKLREAEKDILFQEYQQRAGDLVIGLLRRFERGALIIDLGKCEAVLPQKELAPTEKYAMGARIRSFILEVKEGSRSPEIILSRTHPGFLKKLFELEIPEVEEGIVEIKAVAREAGFRSKVAVFSNSDKIDAVGACVGMRGERIKNIVRELNGERIDIVPWSSDPAKFVENALSPAKIIRIKLDEALRKSEILVQADQLSLAIGRKGQNARLCAKLTGFGIDIMADRVKEVAALEDNIAGSSEVVFSAGEGPRSAVSGVLLSDVKGLDEMVLKSLKQTGYRMAEEVLKMPVTELCKILGIDEENGKKIFQILSDATHKKAE